MRHLRGSVLAQRELLGGREWYHQRFDGAPMFIYAIADAEMRREARKPAAAYPRSRVCFFEGGQADWHLDLEDVRAGARAISARAERDPRLGARLRAAWRADERRFETFVFREFPHLDLRRLSLLDLERAWRAYYDLVTARLSSSAIIDHFALGTDAQIHARLEAELRAHGGRWDEGSLARAFSLATAPVHPSFVNQAELRLLRRVRPGDTAALRRHQRRFFWLRNNYRDARVLDAEHFAEELHALRAKGRAELRRLAEGPAENRRRKTELLRRYRVSTGLRRLLRLSEEFSTWQDERKRATQLNIHVGCAFLEEVARRRPAYSLEQLKYTTGDELPALLRRGTPAPGELDARRAGSVFLSTPRGYLVGTGAEVAAVRALMALHAPRTAAGEAPRTLQGLAASLGRAEGRVRVVRSAGESRALQAGEVLVAVMTRPDYLPAMRRAAAIVTNEGGLTSHAAIVSRELGIPCVIATRVATEVLKDGDRVEVDASRGRVTVLERGA